MFEQLEATAKRYDELNQLLGDPVVLSSPDALRTHAKEQSELRPIVEAYQKYCQAQQELEDNQALLGQEGLEDDFVELVEEENATLRERIEGLEAELRLALLPLDPNDARGALIEIRAGTGGDEAALFAADLFRMYSRYVEAQRWRMEILSSSATETGGIKEIIASIEGPNVYSKMKYESGTHRVQRVPATPRGACRPRLASPPSPSPGDRRARCGSRSSFAPATAGQGGGGPDRSIWMTRRGAPSYRSTSFDRPDTRLP
jgi:peptide chain release factor 1